MPQQWLSLVPQAAAAKARKTPDTAQQDQQEQQAQRTHAAEAADAKAQTLEAMDSAFCEHIYTTALQYLQQHYSYETINQQFSSILDDDDFDDVMNSTIANHFTNVEKNRYRDVVPYDSNRVALPSLTTSNSKSLNSTTVAQLRALPRSISAPAAHCSGSFSTYDDTYINASFISDPGIPNRSTGTSISCSCSSSSSSQGVGYIATQGPLPNTVADFWRMVAAVDISAIVMATELTMTTIGHGASRALCAAYFPDELHDCLRLPGDITVTCVHKTHLYESLLFRQLEVVCPLMQPPQQQGPQQQQQGPQQQQQPVQRRKRLWVNHYKIAGWPDYGVPSDTLAVRALSHALDGCRRAGCKIVVHCSAGVGRTGTFIGEFSCSRLQMLDPYDHSSLVGF